MNGSSDRTFSICSALLRVISVLVPRSDREDWFREWNSELHYSWGLGGRRTRSRFSAFLRCFGAVEDAAWFRIHARTQSMLLHDLRYAVRTFVRNPGFTAVVIITLALGIGANTAIFTLVDAVLLRPLPVANPSELSDVWTTCRRGFPYCTSSYPDFLDYRDRNRSFSDLAAFSMANLVVVDEGDPSVWPVGLVTGNYFNLLGVSPRLGRPIMPNDDQEVDPQLVAVLSHGTWVGRFGSDPDILGHPLRINDAPFRIIGVAPEGFRGTRLSDEPAFWIPMSAISRVGSRGDVILDSRDTRWIGGLIGRRLNGVTVERSRADLDAVSQQLQSEYPTRSGRRITTEATRTITLPAGDVAGDIVRFVSLLMAVVGLALVIACANVANLLLARASARRREIGLRLALGAGRRRLVKQLVTESVLLSVGGAVAGIVVAVLVLRALSGFALPGFVSIASLDLHLDARVLSFTGTLAVATGILFGLVPAFQTSNADLVSSLKANGRDAGAGAIMRSRGWLLTVQIALALVLLVGSGLFIRSLRNGLNLDVGFETRRLAMGNFNLARRQYTDPAARQFVRDLTTRLQQHPGVRSVSSAVYPPLALGGSGFFIAVDGYIPLDGEEQRIEANWVGTGYFETLGIRLIEGRAITALDRENTPLVAVVNETMAARWWPNQSAVGRTFRQNFDGSGDEITIVGVARDVKRGLTEDPEPFVFYPMMQHIDQAAGRVNMLISAENSAVDLLAALQREVRLLDARLPVEELQTLDNRFAEYLMPQRMGSTLLTTLGGLTVLLAVIGIFGVVAYAVNQRRREIGIRLALGGSSAHVLRTVAKGAMVPVAIGTGVGLLAAVALSRFAAGFMYDVAPTDALTLLAAPALLNLVALAAAYVPARRATRINATVALQSD